MTEKRNRLKTGNRYEFVCLQIDIAGHSKIDDAERILHAAKERFNNQIRGIVTTYGGQLFKWEGDGGAFLFQSTDGREFEEAVFAAFRILESLTSVNDEIRLTAGLSQNLAVRISLDSGSAVYDKNPGLITGDFLNAFLKNERAVSVVDEVTITERVYRQITYPLRMRFIERKQSDELGCDLYRSNKSKATLPAAQAVPSSQESDVGSRSSLVDALTRLAPSSFSTLVAMIPGASSHVSRHGTIPEHTEELIRWAESSTGCGLTTIEEAIASFHDARRG